MVCVAVARASATVLTSRGTAWTVPWMVMVSVAVAVAVESAV